jgi:hypothetical protein
MLRAESRERKCAVDARQRDTAASHPWKSTLAKTGENSTRQRVRSVQSGRGGLIRRILSIEQNSSCIFLIYFIFSVRYRRSVHVADNGAKFPPANSGLRVNVLRTKNGTKKTVNN